MVSESSEEEDWETALGKDDMKALHERRQSEWEQAQEAAYEERNRKVKEAELEQKEALSKAGYAFNAFYQTFAEECMAAHKKRRM